MFAANVGDVGPRQNCTFSATTPEKEANFHAIAPVNKMTRVIANMKNDRLHGGYACAYEFVRGGEPTGEL